MSILAFLALGMVSIATIALFLVGIAELIRADIPPFSILALILALAGSIVLADFSYFFCVGFVVALFRMSKEN